MSYGYLIKARVWPTTLTVIPLLVFIMWIISPLYWTSLAAIYGVLPYVANLGSSAALLYLAMHVNRILAKEVFQKIYFRREQAMPTTDFLLWKDSFYPIEIKNLLHQRIFTKFGILLFDLGTENSDEDKARNIITVAVSQIRNALRGNRMLLQHNIEYGFIRNLLGGCLQAVFFSLIIIVIAHSMRNSVLFTGGIIMLSIYTLPLLFSKWILNRYGQNYAKILFEQFLSI